MPAPDSNPRDGRQAMVVTGMQGNETNNGAVNTRCSANNGFPAIDRVKQLELLTRCVVFLGPWPHSAQRYSTQDSVLWSMDYGRLWALDTIIRSWSWLGCPSSPWPIPHGHGGTPQRWENSHATPRGRRISPAGRPYPHISDYGQKNARSHFRGRVCTRFRPGFDIGPTTRAREKRNKDGWAIKMIIEAFGPR